MNGKQIFDRHYRRLLTEGILKSVICGAAVGFGISFIFSFLYWMLAFGNIWIGIVIGIASGILTGALAYRLRYKPTDKTIARRIDRYGLEERMITMLELERDESYIASLQRSDASDKLGAFDAKSIRYTFPIAALIVAAVSLVFSTGFTTLGALAGADLIPYGIEIINPDSGIGTFKIVYEAKEGGSIFGESEQSVEKGTDTSPVLAVADEGWIFVRWDDGGVSPERFEEGVTESATIKAVFERIDKDADGTDEEDRADDLPFGSANEESGGGDSDQVGGENPDSGDSNQGGGKWQDKNQFIDGATYYRDYLDLYYQYAKNIFESDTDIPEDIIEFFEIYFGGI